MSLFLLSYRVLFFFLHTLILGPLSYYARLADHFGFSNKFSKTILIRWNGLQELKALPQRQPHQKVYWFHAASGEIEYAKPVMRELKAKDPQCFIIWSYSSISARDFFSGVVDVDFKFPLPFDSIRNAQQLISKIKPDVFLISRSDLWPELLFQLQRENIPRLLFAATVSSG